MPTKVLFLSCLGWLCLLPFNLFSQGCSDAGLCTIGSMESGAAFYNLSLEELMEMEVAKREPHKIRVSQRFGAGENAIGIWTSELDVEFNVLKNIYVVGALPWTFTNGSMGSTSGLGDLTMGVRFRIPGERLHKIDGTLAVHIPTNDANIKIGGQALPMPYQTSLGTFDLIVGASLTLEKWRLASGYQHVLTNSNANEFEQETGEDGKTIGGYFNSIGLDRGNDLMFRAERVFYGKKVTWFVGTMPIIRVVPDKLRMGGTQVEAVGTSGLTLNFTASGVYQLSKKSRVIANLGGPLVIRENRADGLTRVFVGILTWEYAF